MGKRANSRVLVLDAAAALVSLPGLNSTADDLTPSISAADNAARLITVENFVIEFELLQQLGPAPRGKLADALPWNLRSNAFVAKKSQKPDYREFRDTSLTGSRATTRDRTHRLGLPHAARCGP